MLKCVHVIVLEDGGHFLGFLLVASGAGSPRVGPLRLFHWVLGDPGALSASVGFVRDSVSSSTIVGGGIV